MRHHRNALFLLLPSGSNVIPLQKNPLLLDKRDALVCVTGQSLGEEGGIEEKAPFSERGGEGGDSEKEGERDLAVMAAVEKKEGGEECGDGGMGKGKEILWERKQTSLLLLHSGSNCVNLVLSVAAAAAVALI